jgi:ABC-type polysaccharide/polyol phosphate export permease
VTGTALVFSAGGLFFRDVKFLVEMLLTFGIFFTPVFYKVQMFGEHGVWFMLNPVAPIVEGLDAAIIAGQQPDLAWLGYSASVAIALCIGGYWFFKRVEPLFAEVI